jgi:hypothetical protein
MNPEAQDAGGLTFAMSLNERIVERRQLSTGDRCQVRGIDDGVLQIAKLRQQSGRSLREHPGVYYVLDGISRAGRDTLPRSPADEEAPLAAAIVWQMKLWYHAIQRRLSPTTVRN